MMESESPRPPRRPRYSGRYPRRFSEKYKERQPERYPDDVERVLASGKTPAGMHRPIMLREILEVLSPQPGETVVDCTLGYGGHATELLAAVQPGGRLIALDADPLELTKTEARLRELGFPDESLITRHLNFAGLESLLAVEAPEGVHMILADLGVSSMQIDDPQRGFSFKEDGPLDMRLDPTRGQPASSLLARLNAVTLAGWLEDHADEQQASTLAARILKAQAKRPITTTHALCEVVREFCRTSGLGDSETENRTIRRVFQALRIAVNDEFGKLDALLRCLPNCLAPGGRVAILSFHSGEDRRVKHWFKQGLREGGYSSISADVLRPGRSEQFENPRSSSAKLRFAIRSE